LRLNQQWVEHPEGLSAKAKPPCYQTHYYVTSRSGDSAYELGKLIRSHWQIENCLHWVKDVIFNEDGNGISRGEAAENISMLKSWALTIYRLAEQTSIKLALTRFTNKIKELAELIRRT